MQSRQLKGEKTGKAGEANVAQKIRDFACPLANGINGNEPNLQVNIFGPSTGCPSDDVIYFANIQGAPGPYTYDWKVSPDGFNFGATLSTNDFAIITMPFLAGIKTFIKLEVTSSDGQTALAFFTTTAVEDDSCDFEFNDPDDGKIEQKDFENFPFTVSPNPTKDRFKITIELEETSEIFLELLDLKGRQLMLLADEIFDQGQHELEVSTENISNGIYFVRLRNNSILKTEKIILNK